MDVLRSVASSKVKRVFQSNKSLLFSVQIFIVLTVFSIALFAQKQTESRTVLTVTVISASQNGAVVPGARIFLRSGNRRFSGKSDAEGGFQITVPRGVYALTVRSYGFDLFERRNLRIRHLPVVISADLIPSEIVTDN